MKCYNHYERDAVAICKNCGKGLCKECAVELDNGLISCKGNCEKEVKYLKEMTEKSKKVYNKTAKTYYTTSLIYILLGLAFIGFGLLSDIEPLKPFVFVCGGVMLIGSILMALNGKRYKK